MRNPYTQFADGMATELETFCYFQHQYAASLCPVGGKVLDVCCGRGLIIPMLQYHAKPYLYVGVDIEPTNARWRQGADPRREKNIRTWDFRRIFVKSDVAEMADVIEEYGPFDLVTYTSSIEHMHPEGQKASLLETGKVVHKDSLLYLTCPVTENDQDGYDCQYAAHVYEPSLAELHTWLADAGWKVQDEIGLITKATRFKEVLTGGDLETAMRIYRTSPRPQALTTIALLYPQTATEVALLCTR